MPPPGNGHDHGLARRVSADVARRLAAEAAGPDGAQPLTAGAARRAGPAGDRARRWTTRRPARFAAPAPPLDAATEGTVGQAVFDALFGLGGFQPFLDDPAGGERQRQRLRPGVRPYADGPAGPRRARSPAATPSWRT